MIPASNPNKRRRLAFATTSEGFAPPVEPVKAERGRTAARRRLPWYPIGAGLILLAGLVFWLVRVGSSSLFIDESLTWVEAHSGLGTLWSVVKAQEINPPGYPVFLHGWIAVSPSNSEAWLRLPSVLAAVVLVGAVMWLTALIADRRASLLVGFLAIISPWWFDYGQQLRAYIFVAMAVTISVAAVLQAERSEGNQRRWIALSIVAAAIAQAGHYTAWLVLVPLGVYVVRFTAFDRRTKVVWASVVAIAGIVWFPLLASQMSGSHNDWLTTFGTLTATHFGESFGAAFSGRIFQSELGAVLGSAIVIVCSGAFLYAHRTRTARLVGALALISPLALLAVTIVIQPALVPRYCAMSVPFMASAIAIALTTRRFWWPARALVLIAAVGLSLNNVRAADVAKGRYLDLRSAFQMVFKDYHRGDAVVLVGSGGILYDLDYYNTRLVPHGVHVSLVPLPKTGGLTSIPAIATAAGKHETVWLVNSYTNKFKSPHLHGYKLTEQHDFPGVRYIRVSRLAPG